ncbi:MAG: DUF748 domain-containing protein [Georgfuchsia sp.]
MRLPSRKSTVVALLVLVLVYLLGSWLLLPRVLQSQSEQFFAEKTGHSLTMDRPEFNPFKLSLRLHNLHLLEPDGKPLLGFKELLVDFSATSIYRRAWVFDVIRLDGLDASIVELPGQRLNWSVLLEAFKSKETPAQPATPLPRLEIASLTIAGGQLELADRRTQPGVEARIEPLDLHLEEFSTLPDNNGRYRLSVRTDLGTSILWQGELSINPLAVSGHFDVDGLPLARLAQIAQLPLHLAPPDGIAGLSADYRFSLSGPQIDLVLDQIEARIASFKLRTTQDALPLLALDDIVLKGGRFDLRQRNIVIASIAFSGGNASLLRNAEGRLNVLDLLLAPAEEPAPSTAPKQVTPARQNAEADWHYRVGHIALSGLRADISDQTMSPVAQLALQDIAVDVDNLSDQLDKPWPLRASFSAGDGGRFEAEGSVVAAEPSVDIQIKLVGLSLKPVQSYLGAATTLTLASGVLSTAGRARYGPSGTGYSGSVAVSNLRLTEAGSKADFMVWKSLTARKLEATPAALQIGDLALNGLNTQLIIARDKTVNLSGVMRPQPGIAPSPPASKTGRSTPPYRVDIDHLRITGSEMEFSDYSLMLPFGTHIHHLHGTINGISSRPGASGQIELDGQVDDYGLASASGQINLSDPTDSMDLKVIFKNIEMTRLTPYVATFAGRKIKSGKLSLDLDYKIKQRQLLGENKVVMDQLTLGERVESPQAKNLPLDLALALLQDSDGRIDLGLPVSGSLDDPQFSLGGIVWKVVTNLLTKVATAPFRALGALFGDDETLENISFEAGRAQLTPPEREKLAKLAAALGKRPRLTLSLRGTWAEPDRGALQDLQLRRAVAAKIGQLADEQDPGPIPIDQPKTQTALEDLYADRVGSGELAALKEGFRKANPGQLKESVTGQMLSGMTNVFHSKQVLSESEVAQLKGKDFHAVLYQRLRSGVVVTDAHLQTLAEARGASALAELMGANVAVDRLTLQAAGKTEAKNNEIPLGMEVAATGK